MKKVINKKFLLVIAMIVVSITSVYAVTLIKASDVVYDNSKSGGSSNNVQGAIDELYDLSESGGSGGSTIKLINENMITYVTNLAKTDTTNLAYDDTTDKNLRYIGPNPNNYVEFNGELWRIIGVMNNIKDSTGTSASRVKIIRDVPIRNLAWDSNNTNNWSTASLQKLLNSGDYYNRANTYSSIGLTNESKNMISSIIWNLGGWNTSSVTSSVIYMKERGTTVYSGNPTNWKGHVGLMYPSDYGYAVDSNKIVSCSKTNIGAYSNNDCYSSDWLYVKEHIQWTLSTNSDGNKDVLFVDTSGEIHGNLANENNSVRPVVYLDTKLLITKGKGTAENPYKISFEKEIPKLVDISNASPPKIDDEEKLKPVKLADDGTITYVSQDDEEWYNYAEKKWANAVILVDSPSKTYKVGETIKEADIESYFVWIPKYKYKLWNTGSASKKVHTIEIIFDTNDTVDKEGESCKTPMTTGATGNCNNGEWMTHPAFISLGVNGFWVGKFETGYKGATTTAAAQVNSSDSSKIIVKPNVYSWRNNTVYNMFVSSYNYERTLDSHMMKNTEWGAVAFLSHSKYGQGAEININNNSSYKTGFSALPTTNQHTYPGVNGDGAAYNQSYNTSVGYLASTTGNISGVYDISGGAWEYVSAYISGKPGSSGFTTTTLANYNEKYFDVYNASSAINTYQYRILGDATGEMGPFQQYLDGDNSSRWHSSWYGDDSYFVASTFPWFARGGFYDNGVLAGAFYFARYTGAVDTSLGSRIVLTG